MKLVAVLVLFLATSLYAQEVNSDQSALGVTGEKVENGHTPQGEFVPPIMPGQIVSDGNGGKLRVLSTSGRVSGGSAPSAPRAPEIYQENQIVPDSVHVVVEKDRRPDPRRVKPVPREGSPVDGRVRYLRD